MRISSRLKPLVPRRAEKAQAKQCDWMCKGSRNPFSRTFLRTRDQGNRESSFANARGSVSSSHGTESRPATQSPSSGSAHDDSGCSFSMRRNSGNAPRPLTFHANPKATARRLLSSSPDAEAWRLVSRTRDSARSSPTNGTGTLATAFKPRHSSRPRRKLP